MTLRSFVRRRSVSVVAGVSVLALGMSACGGTTKESSGTGGGGGASASASANPNAQIKKGLKLAFLPKQINNPYEKIVDYAGIGAAKEFAGEAKEVGPSDASASSQVSYIN